jgi:hypothetical protein
MVSSRTEYENLCELVRERGGMVKLTREPDDAWGLLVTLPSDASGSAVAGGFVVRDLSELDVVAYCLLDWLDSVYEAPSDDEGAEQAGS